MPVRMPDKTLPVSYWRLVAGDCLGLHTGHAGLPAAVVLL